MFARFKFSLVNLIQSILMTLFYVASITVFFGQINIDTYLILTNGNNYNADTSVTYIGQN